MLEKLVVARSHPKRFNARAAGEENKEEFGCTLYLVIRSECSKHRQRSAGMISEVTPRVISWG